MNLRRPPDPIRTHLFPRFWTGTRSGAGSARSGHEQDQGKNQDRCQCRDLKRCRDRTGAGLALMDSGLWRHISGYVDVSVLPWFRPLIPVRHSFRQAVPHGLRPGNAGNPVLIPSIGLSVSGAYPAPIRDCPLQTGGGGRPLARAWKCQYIQPLIPFFPVVAPDPDRPRYRHWSLS